RCGAQNELELLIVTRSGQVYLAVLCFFVSLYLCVSVVSRIYKHRGTEAQRRVQSLTYSKSNGLPLMPAAGAAIQLAILPGSNTGCIKLRTYSRSSIVGSHCGLCCSNSSREIKLPPMS